MEDYIWVEKYRPEKIDGLLGNEHLISKLKAYIEDGEIPHLLFNGPAGCGKSTAAKILKNDLSDDSLYINASDENSVETIRNQVKRFAQSLSLEGIKIIVLDEFDYVSQNGQAAMRNIMEQFHENTRFILTANYVERILEPIKSRCQRFEFRGAGKKRVAKHLIKILKNEDVQFDIEDVKDIIREFYPDIRRVINGAQQLVEENDVGERILTGIENIEDKGRREILEAIKENDVDHIRWVMDKKNYDEDRVIDFLWNHIEELTDDFEKQGDLMLTLNEYQYKGAFVANKRINLIACAVEVCNVIH